jgi:hypothetical protein
MLTEHERMRILASEDPERIAAASISIKDEPYPGTNADHWGACQNAYQVGKAVAVAMAQGLCEADAKKAVLSVAAENARQRLVGGN